MGFRLLLDGKTVLLDRALPLLPLRDVVLFPGITMPLFIARPTSVGAVGMAEGEDRLLFTVTQHHPDVSDPKRGDLHEVGTVVRLRQVLRLPDGSMRILVEGLARARLRDLLHEASGLRGVLGPGPREGRVTKGMEDLLRDVQSSFLDYARHSRRIPEETVREIVSSCDPIDGSFRIASQLRVSVAVRQGLLDTAGAARRLQLLSDLLKTEARVARMERALESPRDPEARPGKAESRRRRLTRSASGAEGEGASELAALDAAIRQARMPGAVREKALREVARLSKMAALSPEATVSRTYVEWLLAVPWAKRTRDRVDLTRAENVLNEDHHGLETVKERVLELIAVLHLSRRVRGPVLCLVGPPGVGKTSLGRSIARALGRRFVRMSLGGVRDEAEIRGHRRTYIGAMPGRIVQAMRRAGTVNPVILLDEVDKLGMDYRGDPAAALLEVLDPEQNSSFNDHYLEVDYDLSRVLFVTTANGIAEIPAPLRDRMEVLPLSGYLAPDKLAIAERFLLPKQRKACGLKASDLRISSEAITRIITGYTREAGVRNLEREVSSICRKAARRKAEGTLQQTLRIDASDLEDYLGPQRFQEFSLERRDRVGVATGLAWSATGGSLLQIEVGILPGNGRLQLTGRLGRVLRESARTAISCVRAHAVRLGIDPAFHRRIDLHIHLPEGEVPKDGPSAGAAIALALVSALTQRPTRRSVALTGELTLRGRVLPIGGLTEKVVAARRAGVRTIMIPWDNRRAATDLSPTVAEGIRFVPVRTLLEVVRCGLGRPSRRTGTQMVTLPAGAIGGKGIRGSVTDRSVLAESPETGAAA